MVSLTEIQTVYYMVAATGVLVAAIFYVLNLRVSQKNQELTLKALEQSAKAQQMTLDTRQAQLLMQIYDRNCDPSHQSMQIEVMSWSWNNIDDFTAKYGPKSNPSGWAKFVALNQWYEGIGILIKNELISPRLVDDLLSASVMQYWERYGPLMLEQRKRWNIPQAGEGVELLYNSVKGIAVGEHPELAAGIWSPAVKSQ